MKKSKGNEKSKTLYASGRAVITRRGVFAFARKLGQKLGAKIWQRLCNYFLVFLPIYTLVFWAFTGRRLAHYLLIKTAYSVPATGPFWVPGGIFPALCHKNCIFYKHLSGKQF